MPDLLKVARDVNSATYSSFEAFGLAAVLYALVQEHCFHYLEAPIERVTGWATFFHHSWASLG